MNSLPPCQVFDDLADDYDANFATTAIGRLMRRAVWRRLDTHFHAGHSVLELNCGTGEDAVHLGSRGVRVLATDGSSRMVEIAAAKVCQTGLTGAIELQWMPIERLRDLRTPPFDGAFSNFGGLNCISDPGDVARALAGKLRVGATLLLCVMGPLVPWEWLWFLYHGEPRKAFRRLQRGGCHWRGVRVQYPSISRLRKAFYPAFTMRRVSALGTLVPPPYAGEWASRHRGLLEALERWERRLETVPPLPWLADHYVLELQRA
jgi:SAM-dependent methyltransferase